MLQEDRVKIRTAGLGYRDGVTELIGCFCIYQSSARLMAMMMMNSQTAKKLEQKQPTSFISFLSLLSRCGRKQYQWNFDGAWTHFSP